MKIEVVFANIVKQPDVEAIVNSANANLRLGSGVAGAIHTAAGPELEAFCQPFAPLELGAALITPGFKFPGLLAARITAKALREFEKKSNAIDLVRICVANEEMRQLYESAVALEGEVS